MIICNSQLDDSQLQAVNVLAALCHAHDGGTPTLYTHLLAQKRVSENNVLYFEDDKLLGFLSVYFFYEDACEISLMVIPTERKRGIAKQLLQAIMELIITKEMKTLIFSTPPLINESWLPALGFCYRNSEYHMQRNSYELILIPAQTLAIRKAVLADIPTLSAIDEACFAEHQEDMATRFNLLLHDSNYTLLLAHQETAIGKAHIHWQPSGAIFSDIAILPQYQRQGLGGELLAYCINYALTQGKIKLSLDVETSNCHALNLYVRHGFKTTNISDYWLIPLEQLRAKWRL